MAKTAKTLSDGLISHLANIEKTRKKSIRLLNEGLLANRDLDVIYGGLYIEAATTFERFIEQLFISLLSEKVKHPSNKVKPKTTFKTYEIAWFALHGERPYLDWLPYERFTKKRAKAFFANGLPFTSINGGTGTMQSIDKDIEARTDKILIIRNALAHKSQQAYRRFKDEIVEKSGSLHSREKSPIGYLRGTHSIHPVLTTRYEQIINDIKYITVLLTTKV